MIQKGIIAQVIDKYTYKIRIPKYDKIEAATASTKTDDLSQGIVCAMPGVDVSYVSGDIVLVSFENDELSKPIILGLLYREQKTDSDISLTNVDNSLSDIQNNLQKINSSGLYTHIRYSNDNGLTFTSLFSDSNHETIIDGEVVCQPLYDDTEVNGIKIDKATRVISWSIIDSNNADATDEIGIEITVFDSNGNIIKKERNTDHQRSFTINNSSKITGDLYFTYKLYVTKQYLDTLSVMITTDKAPFGVPTGEYVGVYVSNNSRASINPSDYSWFQSSAGGDIDIEINNKIARLSAEFDAKLDNLKDEVDENFVTIYYKSVEWTPAEVDVYCQTGYEGIWSRGIAGYSGEVKTGNVLYITVHNTGTSSSSTDDSYGQLEIRALADAAAGESVQGVVLSYLVSAEIALDALARFKSSLLEDGDETLIYGGHISTGSISVDQITDNNLGSDNHKNWINLHEGKFQYADNANWDSATRGLAWDGNSLSVKADLLRLQGTILQPSEIISDSTTYYIVETSEDVTPDIDDPGWTPIAPPWTSGTFIWEKTVVTYIDDIPSYPHKSITGPVRITGNAGRPGTGYTVLLTNESHTFAGTTTSAVSSSTTTGIIAYRDSTQIATSVGTITGIPTGMSVIKNNNGTTSTSLTINVTSSMVTANGMLTIPITVDGQTFNKNFVYSIAFSGIPGESATVYMLNLSTAAISKDTEGNYTPSAITLTGKSQSSDNSITAAYSGRFIIETTEDLSTSPIQWVEVYRSTNNESVYTYTIPSNVGGVRCSMYIAGDNPWVPNPNYLIDQQIVPVVYDGEDNIMIQILSSNGNVFKNNVISTSLTAKVYKGGENITDFIDNSKFSWIKINPDESEDPTWSRTGKTITLTSSDVSSRATFICTANI